MAEPTEETDERVDERPSDAEKTGWAATLQEQQLVADERREAGWEVLTVQAGDTAPEPPDAGDTDRFGLVYVIPGDEADEFAALLEGTEINEFEAYRRTVGTTCFLLTELRDTANERCVLVAGAYELGDAEALADHAAEVGHLFSRFQRLDGSVVAAVRHESYEKLLPPLLTE
jgi:hypothetical protein